MPANPAGLFLEKLSNEREVFLKSAATGSRFFKNPETLHHAFYKILSSGRGLF